MKHFLTCSARQGNCIPKRSHSVLFAVGKGFSLFFLYIISLFTACKTDNNQAEQLYKKGRKHRIVMQLDSALFYFSQAEEAINRHTPPLIQGRIYFAIGDLLEFNENRTQSNEYYEKAVKAYHKANYPKMETYTLTRIASNHYWITKDLPAALQYLQQAQAIVPDDTIQGIVLHKIGLLHFYDRQQDSARLYLRRSLAYPSYREEQSMRLLFLSYSFSRTHQSDSAEYYAVEALKYPAATFCKKGCYDQLYKIAQQRNDTCAMTHYAQLSLQQQKRTYDIKGDLSREIQNVHQDKVEEFEARHDQDVAWLLVACGAVVVLAGGVWLLVRFVRYYKRWQATARVRHKNLHVRNERLAKENGKLATRNRKLASENESLATRNKHLREALERERQQRESYAQLKQSLLCAYKTERNRVLESRLQHLKEQLDAACAPAEQCPLLSQEYKTAIAKGYRQVLHWDAPDACLALFNEQFDHFADRAEQWCANRRSQKRSTARLCCLLLVDTMKTHVEILMDYKEGTYERTLDRLQRHTRTATEQDFRLELYKVAFLKAEN